MHTVPVVGPIDKLVTEGLSDSNKSATGGSDDAAAQQTLTGPNVLVRAGISQARLRKSAIADEPQSR